VFQTINQAGVCDIFTYYNYQDDAFTYQPIYLYDQPEFTAYRDNHIDAQFTAQLQKFLQRHYGDQLAVHIMYNSANDSLAVSFTQEGLKVFFDVHVDANSILYNYLPTNQYFQFTNIPIKRDVLASM
jgi:hypothetical protein